MTTPPLHPLQGTQRPDLGELRERWVTLFNPTTEAAAFVVMSQRVFGYMTHFRYERVLPCTISIGECESCAAGWKPRWRGFVPCQERERGGRYLVPVTEGAWKQAELLRERDGRLRGSVWLVRRITWAPQSQVEWSFHHDQRAFIRAEPIDTIAVLSRIWRIDLKALASMREFNGDLRPLLQPYGPKKERKRWN